jgi:hypothetical protein
MIPTFQLGQVGRSGQLAYPNPVSDPHFASVKLLLHADGANGSTTFTDSSSAARTVTANGNAQLSTANARFGASSGLLDGNDSVSTASHADFNFGTGDFTLEGSYRFAALPGPGGQVALMAKYNGGGNQRAWLWYLLNTAGVFTINFLTSLDGAGNFTSTPSAPLDLTTGIFYDLSAARVAGTVKMFMRGQMVAANASHGASIFAGTAPIAIGAASDLVSTGLNGNFDEVRITSGVGRYVTNYAVATNAFQNS